MSASTPFDNRDLVRIKERVQLPGIFLLVGGVVNLLFAGFLLVSIGRVYFIDKERLKDELENYWKQMDDKQKKQLEDAKIGKAEFFELIERILNGIVWGGAVAVGIGVVTTLGGGMMLRMRGRGLASLGCALVAIPFIAPLGCCLFGAAVGIWCLVVLLNPDVAAAFAAPSRSEPPPPGEGMLS